MNPSPAAVLLPAVISRAAVAISLLLMMATPTAEAADALEVMGGAELQKLASQEQYVIALFCDEDSKGNACDDYETELTAVREDLVDSLNAWVVKVTGAEDLRRIFDPTAAASKKPTVVFFRSGTPVLYSGPADEDEMLGMFGRYKDPCLVELIDDNFEHLTQAATGATTGDWLVQFFREDCEECFRQRATLEGLACRLKGRMNVAMVDKGSRGAATGRRFAAGNPPAYIFFRLGRMYRYTVDKFDMAALEAFATGFYKNMKAEAVPLPKSPFDDLVQLCVDYLNEYPALFAVMVGIPLVLLVAFYFLMRSDGSAAPKTKKKKKAKSSSSNKEKSS